MNSLIFLNTIEIFHNFLISLTRYGYRGSKRPQAYTFFKALYEGNFLFETILSYEYTSSFLFNYLKN